MNVQGFESACLSSEKEGRKVQNILGAAAANVTGAADAEQGSSGVHRGARRLHLTCLSTRALGASLPRLLLTRPSPARTLSSKQDSRKLVHVYRKLQQGRGHPCGTPAELFSPNDICHSSILNYFRPLFLVFCSLQLFP